MTEFSVVTEISEQPRVVIVKTTGYIEDRAGEKIKSVVHVLMEKGEKNFLFHLGGSPIINSTGISCMLEVIEEITCEVQGWVGLCCLTKAIKDVFTIMCLLKEYPAFDTQEAALKTVPK